MVWSSQGLGTAEGKKKKQVKSQVEIDNYTKLMNPLSSTGEIEQLEIATMLLHIHLY